MAMATANSNLELLRRNVGLTSLNFTIDSSSVQASLLVPADQDALLNMYVTHAAELGELTPYYGVVWPSAIGLSQHLPKSAIPSGSEVLELGCGCGLGGIAAALTCAPRRVVLTDIDPIAVELSRMSAEASGAAALCTAEVMDWHDAEAWPVAAYDVAIGADIIYEPEACDAIAAVLARTLRPGGTFLLADGKGRRNRALLWEGLLKGGLFSKAEESIMEVDDRNDARGQLDQRMRAASPQRQSVVIARFVRSSVPHEDMRPVGVC